MPSPCDTPLRTSLSVFLAACLFVCSAQAELLTVVRPTDLKSDRYLDAPTLKMLQTGESVESLKSEAGWVQIKSAGQQGWVRAMALKGFSASTVAAVAQVETGRSGRNNSMSTTGVRSIPRASRHALIIGIGQYSASGIMTLKGVSRDMESAKSIAQSMSIPEENISYLRDQQATADQIRKAVQDLNERVRNGDRVFVYYSGHGTRWMDPSNPDQCTEGLLSSDGQALSNVEVSSLLSPIAAKTDKLFVFYDACHSGGIAGQPLRTRSVNISGGQTLTPKFSASISPEACAKPSNLKTRSLSTELSQKGAFPENVVSIAASRPDEVSFDDARTGGLATVAWRDCMQGKAKDLDGNGVLNVEEITSCAQNTLNQTLTQFPDILGQHMTIGGNKAFIPSYQVVSASNVAPTQPDTVPTQQVTPPVAAPDPTPAPPSPTLPSPVSATQVATAMTQPTPSPVINAAPELPAPSTQKVKPADLLGQIHAQRDAKRRLQVSANPKVMRILQDPLQLSIQSPESGYIYIALAGSDQKSLYLLFPNGVDGNNYVRAHETVQLPRAGWRITAAGPQGVDTVLVMVTDSPRDLSQLQGEKAGPFVKTLLTPEGNSQLQVLLGLSGNGGEKVCQQGGKKRNLEVSVQCSDSFASELIQIQEREAN